MESTALAPLPSCTRPRMAAMALMAGVTSGLVSWIACECAHDVFHPRLSAVPRWEAVWMEPTVESRYTADLRNAALANAVLCCSVGFALGLAGGMAGSSLSRGLFVGLGAQAVGLLVGASAALALIRLCHPVAQQHLPTIMNDVWLPLLMHAGVWSAMGAVGGAAFAIGIGYGARLWGALGCATAGAVLAAVVFQLVSLCLPLDAGATRPVARWPVVRLVAMLLPNLMIAAGAVLGTGDPARTHGPVQRPT